MSVVSCQWAVVKKTTGFGESDELDVCGELAKGFWPTRASRGEGGRVGHVGYLGHVGQVELADLGGVGLIDLLRVGLVCSRRTECACYRCRRLSRDALCRLKHFWRQKSQVFEPVDVGASLGS